MEMKESMLQRVCYLLPDDSYPVGPVEDSDLAIEVPYSLKSCDDRGHSGSCYYWVVGISILFWIICQRKRLLSLSITKFWSLYLPV